jgi:hypothetical protein
MKWKLLERIGVKKVDKYESCKFNVCEQKKANLKNEVQRVKWHSMATWVNNCLRAEDCAADNLKHENHVQADRRIHG